MEPPIISAFIALGGGLVVFAGTQWILHCRANTDRLRIKLEELCAAYIAVQKSTVDWRVAHAQKDNSKWAAILLAHGDLLMRINLLTALHFRQNLEATERFVAASHPRIFMRFMEMSDVEASGLVNDMLTRAAQAWQSLVIHDADFTRAKACHLIPRWRNDKDTETVRRIVELLPLPPLTKDR